MKIDGRGLTIDQTVAAATREGSDFAVSEDALRAMNASRDLKLEILATGKPIYGVTTGFGDSVNRQISPEKTARLQNELIRYHLNGTGPLASDEVVRATLLIRANCLARGNSGVSMPVVERLLDFVRHDILPTIPERGSVGASGDLVPLCYLAHALTGQGKVRHNGEIRQTADVLSELGLEPVALEAKDGLALINGTSFSSAFAVLNAAAAAELAEVADICTALASEGMLGNRGHYAPFIHNEKPHDGQRASAALVHELLEGSTLAMTYDQVVDLNDPLDGRHYQKLTRSIQDRYSLRCAPHVTGVLRDMLDWVAPWLTVEINSSSDNPLFDPSTGAVYSGGNFYGGHVVTAMDSLKTAVAACRRPPRPAARAPGRREVQQRPHPEPDRPGGRRRHRGRSPARLQGHADRVLGAHRGGAQARGAGLHVLPFHRGAQPGQGQHGPDRGPRRAHRHRTDP